MNLICAKWDTYGWHEREFASDQDLLQEDCASGFMICDSHVTASARGFLFKDRVAAVLDCYLTLRGLEEGLDSTFGGSGVASQVMIMSTRSKSESIFGASFMTLGLECRANPNPLSL